ncbi:MAG: hypothetical protein KatS3mg027_2453 [Bacteroidia bacterium]|nr:MAG: hypothetical protein KatS3mg027_2453 [Bacteroidia bacterium]
MKTYGYIAGMLMVCRLIIAQPTLDWAPVGAKWYYDLDVAGGE